MDYKEFLKQIVKECYSKADLCRALDKKPTGGNYATIDKIIKDYELDTSHFKNEPYNAIRKWCDKFGFPRHRKELQEYIKNLKP